MRALLSHRGFTESLLMLLLPYIAAIPVFLYSERPFPGALYAAGTGIEFAGSLMLMLFHLQKRIDLKGYRLYEYFLRTIIGLPMSIYLSLFGLYGILGLIRLVVGMRFLERIGFARGGTAYTLFFVTGYLSVASMISFPPSGSSLLFALTSLSIGLLWNRSGLSS